MQHYPLIQLEDTIINTTAAATAPHYIRKRRQRHHHLPHQVILTRQVMIEDGNDQMQT
jgi:hypothetical protein